MFLCLILKALTGSYLSHQHISTSAYHCHALNMVKFVKKFDTLIHSFSTQPSIGVKYYVRINACMYLLLDSTRKVYIRKLQRLAGYVEDSPAAPVQQDESESDEEEAPPPPAATRPTRPMTAKTRSSPQKPSSAAGLVINYTVTCCVCCRCTGTRHDS